MEDQFLVGHRCQKRTGLSSQSPACQATMGSTSGQPQMQGGDIASAGGGTMGVRFCEVSTWTIFSWLACRMSRLSCTVLYTADGNFHCVVDLIQTGSGQVSQGSASGQPHSEEGKPVQRARW
jgi:hypothetical protein